MGVGGARFGTADFIGIYPVSAAFQPTCKFDFVASNMLIDPPGVREGASRGGGGDDTPLNMCGRDEAMTNQAMPIDLFPFGSKGRRPHVLPPPEEPRV